MRFRFLATFLSVLVVGCASNQPAVKSPAPLYLEFAAVNAADSAIVKDHRSDHQRVSHIIEEYTTTTILLGDDLIHPRSPELLGVRLRRAYGDSLDGKNISLRIFIVSIEGHNGGPTSAPLTQAWIAGAPIGANVAGNLLVAGLFAAMTGKPKEYKPFLLRVGIEGDINDRPFRGRHSVRLNGEFTADDLLREINGALEEAITSVGVAAPELIKKSLRFAVSQNGARMPQTGFGQDRTISLASQISSASTKRSPLIHE